MPSVDFHGRTQELTLLDDELERAAAGRFGAVLIDGEAGIGKTRLAAEVRSIAERRGVASFFGRGEELGVRPFGALAEAFACTPVSEDGRRAKLARLLAGGTPEHDPGLQHRIVDAFVDLIEREAPERGALLVVDDLQWADSSTLLTLRFVARRLTFTPLLLVGLFRPVPRRHALERLVDALTREGARQISLGPLASEEVEALVREVIGAQPGPRLSRLLAGTAGNPLFISELLSVNRSLDWLLDGMLRLVTGVILDSRPTLSCSGHTDDATFMLRRGQRHLLDQALLPGRAAAPPPGDTGSLGRASTHPLFVPDREPRAREWRYSLTGQSDSGRGGAILGGPFLQGDVRPRVPRQTRREL